MDRLELKPSSGNRLGTAKPGEADEDDATDLVDCRGSLSSRLDTAALTDAGERRDDSQ